MHFNGRFILNLIDFASQLGANRAELVQKSGHSVDELCLEDFRVGPEVYNGVCEMAMDQTGDPFFGLHAGQNLNLTAGGLIVQIAHTSQDVKQALEYCCEFANLGCSALPTALIDSGSTHKLTLTPDPFWRASSEISTQQTVYGYLSFMIREFQSLTRNEHYPIEVWLDWPEPQNSGELQAALNCVVKFEQPQIAMIFDSRHVELPVVTSDFALLGVLVEHAERKRAELENGKTFYDVVKRSIVTLVKPEFPTIEQVASHLNMSVRTFQRRLKEEGYSFKKLINQLRKEFAMNYLKQDDLSISEVAYLLDYSDPSAFIRSFKNWTGYTPKQYKATLNS